MAAEADEDVQLIRASASLSSDLQGALPKLFWKRGDSRRVHHLVRIRDLDHVIQLIEPFQSEPQLLDSSLKNLVPPIVEAYLAFLHLPQPKSPLPGTLTLDVAASRLLYTFCKVRGEKIIIGFLNNEPRYLELILTSLESTKALSQHVDVPWYKSYILLLWLTHLMLVPFDLISISTTVVSSSLREHPDLPQDIPPVTRRVLALGTHYLVSATREQDAAAKLLSRLVNRPDMQRLHLPTSVVSWALQQLSSPSAAQTSTLHDFLGPLRFLVSLTVSSESDEIAGLIPSMYVCCQGLMDDAMLAFLNTSAITKKLAVKLFRNVALLSLQPTTGKLLSFFQSTSVLENTIEYCLQSLEDRDTPVRFAASKALSMIILRLDPEMGHEVVQAVLESFKEDMPRTSSEADFGTANPLRWHGLTLTLAHALFRRSASPKQLPDILKALLLALSFEQRTAVGVSTGNNVRDAACFGIWSLARRYTSKELLSVESSAIEAGSTCEVASVIQVMANHLLLSACLDPSGNIRRGSSAALQELIGRHPDKVSNGISLVQTVDYHAVGLRQRAMIDVAQSASELDTLYRSTLLVALTKWRGLGSPDVSSREAAAEATGRLCSTESPETVANTIEILLGTISDFPKTDVENCQGSLVALSQIIDTKMQTTSTETEHKAADLSYLLKVLRLLAQQNALFTTFNPRAVRAELVSALVKFIASTVELCLRYTPSISDASLITENLKRIVSGLLSRSEDTVLQNLPRMIRALSHLHSAGFTEEPVLNLPECLRKAEADSFSPALHGAGRAVALGTSFPWLESVYDCDPIKTCNVLANMVKSAPANEWRTIGLQALDLVVEAGIDDRSIIGIVAGALDAGLNDYTITERGDVGSLVRTRAIHCVSRVWKRGLLEEDSVEGQLLQANIIRLSLEKMDRVRLQAARCFEKDFDSQKSLSESDTSSYEYFYRLFQPLHDNPAAWKRKAILKGCISCAGISGEGLLRASRQALVDTIHQGDAEMRATCLSTFTALLKDTMAQGGEPQALLEVLAHLLDSMPWILPSDNDFNWRVLLSLVQKSHFKSNNIPRILSAVDVYRSLAEKPSVRQETMKKLVSMLRTNPYPKVRVTVAECLLVLTGDQALKSVDWSKPGQKIEVRI